MQFRRMPIEVESPEQMGYETIKNNLSESSYSDMYFRDIDLGKDLKNLVLAYGSHAGHEGIRELITRDNPHLITDDVLLTVGAAAGLFIIATTLLEKDDELIVVRPNYATNIETPRAIGARIQYIDISFEEDFALDIGKIKSMITKKTKYISVTHPHNPTGACLCEKDIKQLIELVETNGIRLLVDETYRDMVFGEQLPLAAGYSSHVISISSLSKTYGLPGIRVGWIICKDRHLLENFLAAKEQIHICGSVLDEEVAFRFLEHKEKHLQRISKDIRHKFEIVKAWINNDNGFEWIEPKGGAVCFPRMCHPGKVDIDQFYEILLKKYGTYTGPGHWFDMPRHYMRVGYGWPTKQQLMEGLEGMAKSLGEARRV
jgi:aspartate/methionine/tyrosine aminotransferase